MSFRWIAVRLESIAGIIKFSAALFAVMDRGSLSPGLAGLCITYAINVTFNMGQLVKSFCDVETNIVSVERIQEYCRAPEVLKTSLKVSSKASHNNPMMTIGETVEVIALSVVKLATLGIHSLH